MDAIGKLSRNQSTERTEPHAQIRFFDRFNHPVHRLIG